MQKTLIFIIIIAVLGFGVYYFVSAPKEEVEDTMEVRLFYYNPEKDEDEQGNIMCSREGLVPVSAVLPKDNIIENTIRLLIQGNVSEAAQAQGVTTEYPLEGFSLEGAVLEDGILTLTFEDPNNKTGGGSCRVGILWFQIEATALQFPEVEEVKFEPEDIFQP
jgi:spore germination protein GerM